MYFCNLQTNVLCKRSGVNTWTFFSSGWYYYQLHSLTDSCRGKLLWFSVLFECFGISSWLLQCKAQHAPVSACIQLFLIPTVYFSFQRSLYRSCIPFIQKAICTTDQEQHMPVGDPLLQDSVLKTDATLVIRNPFPTALTSLTQHFLLCGTLAETSNAQIHQCIYCRLICWPILWGLQAHFVPTRPPLRFEFFTTTLLFQKSSWRSFNRPSISLYHFCRTCLTSAQKIFLAQQLKQCVSRASLPHSAPIARWMFQSTSK